MSEITDNTEPYIFIYIHIFIYTYTHTVKILGQGLTVYLRIASIPKKTKLVSKCKKIYCLWLVECWD